MTAPSSKSGPQSSEPGPDFRRLAVSVIETEAAAVSALHHRIDDTFDAACQCLLDCRGRIVVCGVGKSGHIGHKIAATLASTGSPAFFIHATEASHGDLGMLQTDDVVIAISYSGNSRELIDLIPAVKRLGVPMISLSGVADSPLALAATYHIDVSVEREACPLNLAPTASTTATLAMGDALAIALLGARGFTEQDFARSHPGGKLGRRLLMRVSDVMVEGDGLPLIQIGTRLSDALLEITRKALGLVLVLDGETLAGVFTDGDLRRTIDTGADIRQIIIDEVMTPGGHRTQADALAVDAVQQMQACRIMALPVMDNDDPERLIGVVTMHALLTAGVI